MKRAGFEVHAISSPGPLADQYSRNEDVPVHPVPIARRIAPWADAIALVRLVLVLRRLKPHVVQAGTTKAGLLGMLAAFLVGAPVRIYYLHGLRMLSATGLRRRVLGATERVACRAATHVLCVGPSVRHELVSAGLCPARKAVVLGDGSCNGVDSTWFDRTRLAENTREAVRSRLDLPQNALVIGFIGRLAREKGIGELHGAWGLIRERYPSAYLLVVGPEEPVDPAPPEALRALAHDSRVRLVGPDWNTAPLFAAMDLFCLPSHREGLPTVLLEAAAMEVPIVAFGVPGVVDAVADGINGNLVEPFSAEALAAAMGRYLDNPRLRVLHGQAGRRRVVERFQQLKVWAELSAFFRSVYERPVTAGASQHGRSAACTDHA